MHEYFDFVSQCIDQMRGGVEIETDQIDYRVTVQLRDSSPERSIALCSFAVERHMLDRLPLGRIVVGSTRSARNRHYLVALVYQTGHQPGADMSCRSDDYRAQLVHSGD